MLRTIIRRVEGDLITSGVSYNNLNPLYHQTVRWRRKPRWLPTAKSKLFRVPERKKLPYEEEEELKRLFNHYRTEMKSIRSFFKAHINDTSSNVENYAIVLEDEVEEHKRCIEINEKWNAEVKMLREQTLAKEKDAELEEILKIIEENKIKAEKRQQEIEEIVRKEKERAKSYITAENIDEAIDKALENVVDYNFAIDLEGNYYHGRNTKPPKPSSANEEKVESTVSATA
ncbi:hypothetical protein O3M35_006619 [Rhynocoris fuscipes]|uniref:Small ribosomal subunit protein mS26 n=1 Tax=Rhynocoris fuscipes TaxID=488301 RepID=A0AAW1DE57_9HEMI